MIYKTTKDISKENLKALYDDAKWTGYTNDMDKLVRAIKKSNKVITAWENEKLIALIRTISDNETIVYIQDILVLENYKRKGIGKELIRKILEQSKGIRQIILLTTADDVVSTSFYRSLNFKSCDDGETVAFRYLGG